LASAMFPAKPGIPGTVKLSHEKVRVRYTLEFKQEPVRLVRGGQTVSENSPSERRRQISSITKSLRKWSRPRLLAVHQTSPGFDLTFYGPFNEYGWRNTTGARTGFDGVVKGRRSVRNETKRTLIVLALNGCQGWKPDAAVFPICRD